MVNCMLIESNTPERQALAGLLESFGLQCKQFADLDAGVADRYEPDFLMIAQTERTPEILRLMGKRKRKPVVIVYGRNADTDLANKTILEGASELLMQPFDRDLLRFKLAQAGVLRH